MFGDTDHGNTQEHPPPVHIHHKQYYNVMYTIILLPTDQMQEHSTAAGGTPYNGMVQ
jgi:hypothetical protein